MDTSDIAGMSDVGGDEGVSSYMSAVEVSELASAALGAGSTPRGAPSGGHHGHGGVAGGSDGKEARKGWKKEEDELIRRSVEELGHKWAIIAERLPGRTDHAIRNRWHRLLSRKLDREQQMEHGLDSAAAALLPLGGAGGVLDSTAAIGETLDALFSLDSPDDPTKH